MATLQQWASGARPRTLPAAVAPVAVGTGSAHALGDSDLGLALLALVVAVALQVGVNYANDYSDGVRGTDSGDRVGPARLVGGRLADPQTVRFAAFFFFGIGCLAGLALVALSGRMELLVVGVAAVWAAWHYTGGKRPYGYRGLGEVAVFLFFGLVAVLGTAWAQVGALDLASWAGAAGVGALACAILVTNNLRDLAGDRRAAKRTLAVRLGPRRTRVLYVGLLVAAAACVGIAALAHPWALLGLLAVPLGYRPSRRVLGGAEGATLVPVLAATGQLQLGYGLLLALGLALAG